MLPRFLIALIVFFSLCCACSKKSTPAKIDGDLLHDFAFKEGSYWIYKDSITGIYDSLVVTSASVSLQPDNSVYSYDHFISGSDTNMVTFNFSLQKNYIVFTYSEKNIEAFTTGCNIHL